MGLSADVINFNDVIVLRWTLPVVLSTPFILRRSLTQLLLRFPFSHIESRERWAWRLTYYVGMSYQGSAMPHAEHHVSFATTIPR